jgi:cytidylate kinase
VQLILVCIGDFFRDFIRDMTIRSENVKETAERQMEARMTVASAEKEAMLNELKGRSSELLRVGPSSRDGI